MKRFRSLWVLLLISATAFFSLPIASAQTITGSIAGDVTDSSGAVVPNATVTVENATGVKRTATSSGSGSYKIPELPIGTYKVSAAAEGFKTVVRNADVVTGGVTHADFALQVGLRTETVEVEGAAPFVAETPDADDLIDVAARSGYLLWTFRPVRGGLWKAVADDQTLEADGRRKPPCPYLSEPPRMGARQRKTIYRFGKATRLIV